MAGGDICFHDRINDYSYFLRGGNPPVNLPFSDPNIAVINLPGRSTFGSTPPVRGALPWQPYLQFGETLVLQNPIPRSQCDDAGIDYSNTLHVIGNLANSNNQLRYARYLELDENTLDSPSSNGGGDLVDVDGICSNPAMNFVNGKK